MKTDTLSVLDTMRKTIEKYQMFSSGDAVLVGVSGGADSVCLLHALSVLKEKTGIRIAAAHLNHQIRGEEAERDAEFVKELCRKWKIPCYIKNADIPSSAAELGVSEETAGRLQRYRFFRELCEEHGFDRIATAHNRNDQAETILMRVIRGSGIDGLSGIRYVRRDGVVRPLLDVERGQIEAYCRENDISYCTDSTNNDEAYTRNRIRHRLLPILQEEFNPNITAALANMAENMAEDGEFLSGYANRLYHRINSPAPGQKPIVLDMETLSMVQESIRNRLILLAAREAMGKHYRMERVHLEAVGELLKKETGASVQLPEGLRVTVQYGWLAFVTEKEREQRETAELLAREYDGVAIGQTYVIGGQTVTLEERELPSKQNANEMILDYDKVVQMPLQLRTRRRGDRIAVYRDGKDKKLKSFLIDAKIPADEREKIPLLCSGNQVLAVIGHRIAEPYKREKNTKRGLVIRHEEHE